MTIRLADPLPECALCERPTVRDVHDRTGGLCSQCAGLVDDTVKMLPIRLAPPPDDRTVIVEGYRPPVPERKPRGNTAP